jgi:CBS domain-containing protein
MSIGDFDRTMSEFDEAYDDPDVSSTQTLFTADLLNVTVEVLDPPKPLCVSPEAMAEGVIMGMGQRNHGCVLVTKDDVLVGIFTERDVIRKVVGIVDPKTTPIGALMTRDPEAISFHDRIAVVLNKMTVGGFRHVPLVDIRHHPVGVLSMKDLVEFFVEHFPRSVLNVPPNPAMRNPDEPSGAG